MTKPKATLTPTAFVTGIAWVLMVIAGWACLRLSYMLATSFQAAPDAEFGILGLSPVISKVVLIIHLALAAFSIYAGTAMLKLRAWTRPFFATTLTIIGLEAVVAGLLYAFGTSASAAGQGLQSLKLAAGFALGLLGLMCVLLAWKLWRDKGIRGVFQ
jgi:hypothetical protein